MTLSHDKLPLRSAWVEIDLGQLKKNLEAIRHDNLRKVAIAHVIKDEAYGHGALPVARVAETCGVRTFAVVTLEEAMKLRDGGIRSQLLVLGVRGDDELPWCIEHDLTCCVDTTAAIERIAKLAGRAGKRVPIHLKINTGMNRYGARWNEAMPLVELAVSSPSLVLEGIFSHFSMSDETDKTFAHEQIRRFVEVLSAMSKKGIDVKYRHLCNSGGFLDLPQAHMEMVRIGLLPLGIYPSQVCRRIAGIEPAMTVKARVAAIQNLEPGDVVGYGMRYQATSRRRIGVIAVGYGDGFPRLRNAGHALVNGRRAPLVGSVAMDAFMVDLTEIPGADLGSEAVLMGRQGGEEISANEMAQWKNTVSYEALLCWRSRLPRVYLNGLDG